MNRKEFIRKLAKRSNIRIYYAEKFISNLEDLIVNLIKLGETISLHGFCEIGIKEVKDKIGTNPQNSEPMTIKGGKRIYIKSGSRLKSATRKIEA